MMPPSMSAAVETPVPDEPNPTLAPQLPWNSIPKFVPGTTNVQEYTQKLKFLAAMWPDGYLNQLAPRAALLVEGTAFRKVARLDPAKLRVNDTSGVALLVSAIGGSWGPPNWRKGMNTLRKPCMELFSVRTKVMIRSLQGWSPILLSF